MGNYTASQKYYLIDGTELVSVDQDINYNWKRADDRLKPLIEYQRTALPSINDSSLPKDIGFKWYKTYSNSIWYQRDTGAVQDQNSRVDPWQTDISYEPAFNQMDADENHVAYSTFNNFVRLRGSIVRLDGADMAANVDTKFMTLPTAVLPLTNKYLTVYGGDGFLTSDFQMFRIFIPAASSSDKRLAFTKYGAAGVFFNRFFSLTDIVYALDA